MDVSAHLEVRPAPHVLFSRAATRASRPRYMLPDGEGGWTALSWGAHAAAVREVACALLDRGLAAGERVAIFAGNSPRWMEAALGAQAAGLVVVPIYPAATPAQVAYVLQHSDANVVFTDTDGLEAAGRRVVRLDSPEWVALRRRGEAFDAAHPERFERSMAAVRLDAPALMLYTSGTTGAPKGVPLTHGNVAINGRDWLECNAPGLPEGGVDVLWLPMSHIFGFGEACLGNNLGFTTYLVGPKQVLETMPRVRPTVFMSVPAYWEKLAASSMGEADPARARSAFEAATGGRLAFCLSGGAGLSTDVKRHFERFGVVILEGYGLTECSPTLTLNRPGDYRFDSVGKPLPSVELVLADDGEILARGPSVFSGYHNDAESTRSAFTSGGWFKTGDLGRFTDDGFLQIVGRKKEIIVTAGGKNVPPANIERLFASDPRFEHVVVYGDGRKYLVAGIWLPEGQPTDAAEIQAAVDAANTTLARFEQIKRFRVMERPLSVDAGLLTSTLKVRRKRVYAAFAAEFEELYA